MEVNKIASELFEITLTKDDPLCQSFLCHKNLVVNLPTHTNTHSVGCAFVYMSRLGDEYTATLQTVDKEIIAVLKPHTAIEMYGVVDNYVNCKIERWVIMRIYEIYK